MKNFVLEMVGLQRPAPRLVVVLVLHVLLLLVPYATLEGAGISLFGLLNIPSPSVGLTRAYWLLLHGDVDAAIAMNRLIVIAAPLIWAIACKDVYSLVMGVKTKDEKAKSMLQY